MRHLISLLLLTTFIPWAMASDIRITKGTGKTTIDLSGMTFSADTAARDFFTTLQTSLVRSGWLERGRPGASEYRVSGPVQFDGAAIRADLTVAQVTPPRTLFRRTYAGSAAEVRRRAFEAADDIVEEITGRRGFASARLLLIGRQGQSKELYIGDSDGRGLYPLTNDKKVIAAPRWGHDGKSVFYTANLTAFQGIYQVDLTDRKRYRIANYSGSNISGGVSPDGRYMAVILSKDGNPELYVMRLSDRQLTRITRTPRAVESSPSWSPDGKQIVYVSDIAGTPHLFIVSRDGGSPRQLTTRGRQNVSPDWGPRGEIAYSSLVSGKFQVHTIDPQTGQSRQLTSDYADHEDPSWAPDGRHIALAKTENYRSRVYLIDTMGDPTILLVDTQGDWYAPKWSR